MPTGAFATAVEMNFCSCLQEIRMLGGYERLGFSVGLRLPRSSGSFIEQVIDSLFPLSQVGVG